MLNMMLVSLFTSIILFLASLSLFSLNSSFILILPIMSLDSLSFDISILIDPPALIFASTVLIITTMIILFSNFYINPMEHRRFLLILMLFVSSMILFIFSNNILFILLGWDGLGLSSYMLVIYYQNSTASSAGTMTILSNRLGDIFLILAITTTMMAPSMEMSTNSQFPLSTLILFLMASCSKSAQFPLSAWLPAAMAAPTPISALVHSSTLVTAGVFLLYRTIPNHQIPTSILLPIALTTTLYASISALWEQDLKKIIALSTLSQIGFMMFALSINAPNLALFHLIVHALFKSTMFICVGIIIHSSAYQDSRALTIPNNSSPLMSSAIGITNLALMGIPFASGYYSKDSIIEFYQISSLNPLINALLLLAISLTAGYSLRLIKSAFTNTRLNNNDSKLSDSKFLTSLVFLTVMSIITGAAILWVLAPHYMFPMSTLEKMFTAFTIILSLLFSWPLPSTPPLLISTGNFPNTLWFLQSTTSSLPLLSSKPGYNLSSIDSSWHETSSSHWNNSLLPMVVPKTSTSTSLMTLSMIVPFTIN